MAEVNAELHRRDPSGLLVPWRLNADGTDPVADSVARERLQAIVDALSGALAVNGTVTLDAAALAALESITATIAPGAIVDLPPATIAALKAVTATLTPGATVDLPSATIAALRDVTATLAAGTTINLSAASLAALENITATISGALKIDDATPVRVSVVGTAVPHTVELTPAQLDLLRRVFNHEGNALASEAKLEQVRRFLFGSTQTGVDPGVLHEILTLLTAEDFASETTLAAARDALATLRDTLTTVRDTMYRRDDPLPAGTNMVGRVQLDQQATHFVSPTTSLKVEQQRFFIATSGRLSVETSGHFRGVFTNPAGSGRTFRIVRLATFISQGPAFATIIKNPTTGVPTTPLRPVTNANLSAVFQSMAQLRADVSQGVSAVPLGGGVETGWVFGLPSGQRTTFDLPPLVLAAGTSMGVNIPFTGAADTTLSLYFIEE